MSNNQVMQIRNLQEKLNASEKAEHKALKLAHNMIIELEKKQKIIETCPHPQNLQNCEEKKKEIIKIAEEAIQRCPPKKKDMYSRLINLGIPVKKANLTQIKGGKPKRKPSLKALKIKRKKLKEKIKKAEKCVKTCTKNKLKLKKQCK